MYRIQCTHRNSSQPSTNCRKKTVPSHSLMGERMRGEGGEGGETRPHSFQRKEVFAGPGSKVFSDCVSVHEKSAPHMPLPPHSSRLQCIAIPTYLEVSRLLCETISAYLKIQLRKITSGQLRNNTL